MKRKPIEYIVCPECKADFKIECFTEDGIEVEEGVLLCDKGHVFPIINGVPLNSAVKKVEDTDKITKTMKSFGYQWNKFDDMYNFYPVGKEFFLNKLGLNAGCGMGRFIFYGAKYGAEMIGIDLSNAVEAAYRNHRISLLA